MSASPSSERHLKNRQVIHKLLAAFYDLVLDQLPVVLDDVFKADCVIHFTAPIGKLIGPKALMSAVYDPLIAAIPDVERRDFICMAGESRSEDWVGCSGHYMGVFKKPFLDIPPTQKVVAFRFHEFYRMVDGKVVEVHAVWDLPELMMQANAWPLAPSLGVEFLVPGPATHDGIRQNEWDPTKSQASLQLVNDMLTGLSRSPQGVEAMQLDKYWHPKMNWYGPAGIGKMRQIKGFRLWHQIPFLNAVPDRRCLMDKAAFFGDGDYVAYTGWPGMEMTLSGDGWLGIVPSNKKITMIAMDFWRCEKGMIRENWVLIDLIDVYQQLGVDVFKRMREYTYARQPDQDRGTKRSFGE